MAGRGCSSGASVAPHVSALSRQMMNNMGGDDDVDLPEVDGADEVSPRGHGAGAVPVVVGAGQAPAPSSVLTAPGCAGGGAEGGRGHRARGWWRRRASVPICSSCRFSPPFQDSPDSDDESKSLSPLAARCWPDTPGRAGAGGCLPHPAARASALSTGAGRDGSAGEIPVRPSRPATVLAGLAVGGMGSAALAVPGAPGEE